LCLTHTLENYCVLHIVTYSGEQLISGIQYKTMKGSWVLVCYLSLICLFSEIQPQKDIKT